MKLKWAPQLKLSSFLNLSLVIICMKNAFNLLMWYQNFIVLLWLNRLIYAFIYLLKMITSNIACKQCMGFEECSLNRKVLILFYPEMSLLLLVFLQGLLLFIFQRSTYFPSTILLWLDVLNTLNVQGYSFFLRLIFYFKH